MGFEWWLCEIRKKGEWECCSPGRILGFGGEASCVYNRGVKALGKSVCMECRAYSNGKLKYWPHIPPQKTTQSR